jgi:threonine dehydratase
MREHCLTRRTLLKLGGATAVAGGMAPLLLSIPPSAFPAVRRSTADSAFTAIQDAAERIAGAVVHTPCLYSPRLSHLTGAEVFVKFENMQFTGAFKERGALNKLLLLSEDQREHGVIAASAGNHAQGLAYHANRLGVKAIIVMPTITPNLKVSRTANLGAQVVLAGESFDTAVEVALQRAADDNLTFVHPFDDADIIAGQGTVAWEMLTDVPDLDALIVPVGGGGLIAGCATAAKALKPDIRVFGVESERYDAMQQTLQGQEVAVGGETLADGLAVHRVGDLPLAVVRALVDDILVVEEATIERAIALLVELQKSVAEGAGAAGLAALLTQPDRFFGQKVGIILSGGNIDTRLLTTVLLRNLVHSGRLVEVRVNTPDHAANVPHILDIIAGAGATMVEIRYDRLFGPHPAKEPDVLITLETRDHAHARAVVAALQAANLDAELVE